VSIKVLYVGDTQVNVQTSIKGIDSWTFTYYSDSAHYLRDALNAAADIKLEHIRSSESIRDMPSTADEYKKYDCVILSDLGFNSVNLQPGNTGAMRIPMGPDRIQGLHDYVVQGGGFMMVGGWLSFSGIQGKGLWGGTKIEEIMPVTCEPRGVDDRIEVTQGYQLKLNDPGHPIVKGLPWDKPYMFLGYNKTHLRSESHLIASYNGDPLLATGKAGKGRSIIFASDLGPHWAGSFLEWPAYAEFWQRMARWAAGSLG
jgi:uncharacterized membrane protein